MDEPLFQDNFERFSQMCPLAAIQLQDVDCSHIQFCQTDKGELNLKRTGGTHEITYHSQKGALEEAERWLEETCPLGIKVIFIYGIGLGYYYDALQEWMKRDSGRMIVFLEDDLAVIHRFLETERAARILRNSQVIIQYFPTPNERDWGKFRNQFLWCFQAFAAVPTAFEALRLYKEERAAMFQLVAGQLKLNFEEVKLAKYEVIDSHANVYCNFYHNLPGIAQAGFADHLIQKFAHIPAIICGAGPSLARQLPLLRSLEGRAILFGSGSGLNVLNRHGIQPHFGAASDPTPAQESRLMTNTAFELPFFYSHRFYRNAFTKIHGPRLFSASGVGFSVQDWFNRELNLHSHPRFEEGGISTSNFCESIAGAIGNNPIILAGMDLAYTDSSRYASGVTAHPTDDRREHKAIGSIVEKTIPAISVDGSNVKTKWDWVQEAGYFTQFSQKHPEHTVINATEGGLRILEVPHLPLQEVANNYLKHAYDLDNWIHAEIQQSLLPELTDTKVLEAIEKWSQSLQSCLDLVKAMLEELENAKARLPALASGELLTGTMALIQEDLFKEDAFQFFLMELNGWFDTFSTLERKKMEFFPDQFEGQRKMLIQYQLEKARYQFLKQYLDTHLSLLKDGVKAFTQSQERLKEYSLPPENRIKAALESANALYLFENGRLIIRDEETGAAYEEAFVPKRISEEKREHREGFITAQLGVWDGEALLLYPDGSIKNQIFYKEGKRHGPSSFYSQEGNLLAKSWFWNDNRVGKSHQFYLSGQLYSLLRYQEGTLHGIQEYFYPDGTVKTVLNFKEGILDGEVALYYPTGRLKRKLHFASGHLHGSEQYWDNTGLMTIEAEYKNGLPTGKSRAWHGNGKLAKEITFYDNPLNFDLYMWDESGKLVQKQLSLPSKPLDEMIKKSRELMESLEKAAEQISKAKDREHLA